MTLQLKRCPFCGSRYIKIKYVELAEVYCGICKGCRVEGPTRKKHEEAEEAWNKREANCDE